MHWQYTETHHRFSFCPSSSLPLPRNRAGLPLQESVPASPMADELDVTGDVNGNDISGLGEASGDASGDAASASQSQSGEIDNMRSSTATLPTSHSVNPNDEGKDEALAASEAPLAVASDSKGETRGEDGSKEDANQNIYIINI